MSTKQNRQIAEFGQFSGFVLLIALILGALQPITRAFTMMHPARMPINTAAFTPAHMGLTYEDVTFEATDGIRLSGWLIDPLGEPNGAAVIIAHAYANNRVLAMWHAFTLADAGYTVLVFDHRAHGSSDGSISTLGWSEDRDVLGAVSYLQSRGITWIGAAGLSLGAVATLRAATQSDAINAVWADGSAGITITDSLPPCNLSETLSTPYWMIFFSAHHLITGLPRPAPMVATLNAIAPRPTMLVMAEQSEIEACTNQRWAAAADHVETWVVETGHISGMETHRDEYQRRLTTFFNVALNGSELE